MLASRGMRPLAPAPIHDVPAAPRPAAVRIVFLSLGLALLGLAAPAAAPRAARAAEASLGARQTPLAYAPEYGEIVFSDPDRAAGTVVVGTREGAEVRLANAPGGAAAGIYRAEGVVQGIAVRGTDAILFQGDRGFTALDLTMPARPSVIASEITPRPAKMGALLADGSCAVASDSSVYVYRRGSGGSFTLLQAIDYSDGRVIRRVRASGDSILVVASRPGALLRIYVAVYRLPAGATTTSLLHEWIANGKGANDAAWTPPIAFIADGNNGVYPLNTATGVYATTATATGGAYVRSVDVTATGLFAAEEAGQVERFARGGAFGEQLTFVTGRGIGGEVAGIAAAADDSTAWITNRDVLSAVEPDEVGASEIENVSLGQLPLPIGIGSRHAGRSRRVVVNAGLAYVADYSGGLRIYRAGGADTSLVGVLPPTPSSRPVDLALDAAQSRLYLASGSDGLEVVNVSNPAAPVRVGSLPLAGGLASAVTIVNPTTVAVARRGGIAGVTFVDVSTPSAPVARGAVDAPFLDPRALAARDTILYVADLQLGVISVGFGNPDAPAMRGIPSGAGARDLEVQGTILLVGTRSRGLQVVDVFNPVAPILRSEVPLPPVYGVTRNGATAAVCMGAAGTALVDLTTPTAARLRGAVAAAGLPRDAAWVGDTLLVAGGTSVDRFLLPSATPPLGGLALSLAQGGLPRVQISWEATFPTPAAGQAGWNVYRATGPPTSGSQAPEGERVNAFLLAPSTTSTTDVAAAAGVEYRYRLEAVFGDGRAQDVAEGSIVVPTQAQVGRPYPNPFRATDGGVTVPYRTKGSGGVVTLRVADVRGRVIREVRKTGPPAPGFDSIEWDGRTASGRRARAGVYYLYVSGPGVGGARSAVYLP